MVRSPPPGESSTIGVPQWALWPLTVMGYTAEALTAKTFWPLSTAMSVIEFAWPDPPPMQSKSPTLVMARVGEVGSSVKSVASVWA